MLSKGFILISLTKNKVKIIKLKDNFYISYSLKTEFTIIRLILNPIYPRSQKYAFSWFDW